MAKRRTAGIGKAKHTATVPCTLYEVRFENKMYASRATLIKIVWPDFNKINSAQCRYACGGCFPGYNSAQDYLHATSVFVSYFASIY